MIIAEYFKHQFHKNAEPLLPINPAQMRTPFTGKEITDAANRLKNNKSPGVDEIVIEQMKYAPSIIHEKIAEMYNEMTSSGDHPTEIIKDFYVLYKNQAKLYPTAKSTSNYTIICSSEYSRCLSHGKNRRT